MIEAPFLIRQRRSKPCRSTIGRALKTEFFTTSIMPGLKRSNAPSTRVCCRAIILTRCRGAGGASWTGQPPERCQPASERATTGRSARRTGWARPLRANGTVASAGHTGPRSRENIDNSQPEPESAGPGIGKPLRPVLRIGSGTRLATTSRSSQRSPLSRSRSCHPYRSTHCSLRYRH